MAHNGQHTSTRKVGMQCMVRSERSKRNEVWKRWRGFFEGECGLDTASLHVARGAYWGAGDERIRPRPLSPHSDHTRGAPPPHTTSWGAHRFLVFASATGSGDDGAAHHALKGVDTAEGGTCCARGDRVLCLFGGPFFFWRAHVTLFFLLLFLCVARPASHTSSKCVACRQGEDGL